MRRIPILRALIEATDSRPWSQVIDDIPKLLNDPSVDEERKTEALVQILNEWIVFKQIRPRYASLPPLHLPPGRYGPIFLALVEEVRRLYVLGLYYSCVIMSGVTAERIAKDAFVKYIRFMVNETLAAVGDAVKGELESLPPKQMCKILIETGIFGKDLELHFRGLGKLRNKYAHASGRGSTTDARNAIGHLQAIVEGTLPAYIVPEEQRIPVGPDDRGVRLIAPYECPMAKERRQRAQQKLGRT